MQKVIYNNLVRKDRILRQLEVKLDNQLFRILNELLAHEGEIVSREHLIEKIWYGNTYVGKTALTKNIWRLRNILSESEFSECLSITTYPKMGYKLNYSFAPVGMDRIPTKIRTSVYAACVLILVSLIAYFSTSEESDLTLKLNDDTVSATSYKD